MDRIVSARSWGIEPAELLTPDILGSRARLAPLDLAADIAWSGADTRGGVGISVPV